MADLKDIISDKPLGLLYARVQLNKELVEHVQNKMYYIVKDGCVMEFTHDQYEYITSRWHVVNVMDKTKQVVFGQVKCRYDATLKQKAISSLKSVNDGMLFEDYLKVQAQLFLQAHGKFWRDGKAVFPSSALQSIKLWDYFEELREHTCGFDCAIDCPRTFEFVNRKENPPCVYVMDFPWQYLTMDFFSLPLVFKWIVYAYCEHHRPGLLH